MNICGIEIKGSEAIIAVAALDGSALSHVRPCHQEDRPRR
jgi:hypothetical protein